MNTLNLNVQDPVLLLRESESPAPRHAAVSAARILVVDDEPRMTDSLCALLEAHGMTPYPAASGAEALALLNEAQFDVLLLDLRLNDMSGHAVMDFVNGRELDIAIIVLSGNTDIDSAIGALKRGAYGYLRKPYATEELLRTVENAVQKRQLELINRQIASQLEQSEQLYRGLVDSSPDLIYTLDPNGCFTFVNKRVRHLLGYEREELIGRHYTELVHEDDIERARYVFMERRVGDRASRNVELRLKSRRSAESHRAFESTVCTISFNSLGMYQREHEASQKVYAGTYGVARDITDRKRAEEMIAYQAYHDVLTDLPNRVLFRDRLELALVQAKRAGRELAVMFIDLDRFKIVNDTLGHTTGDELLQQVALRLKNCLRRGDTLARMGGDEFTVLLPDISARHDVQVVAEKFLACLTGPFTLDGRQLHVSASIGIAVYPDDGDMMGDLVRHADIAMYQVKSLGKNGYRFYDPAMQADLFEKVDLEESLRHAIERDELEMYYQPQVDARTGALVGAEALMRWNHPKRGLVTAGGFLPYAEETDLIIPLTEWMLEAVCRDVASWKRSGIGGLRVAMNLSPRYLERGDFYQKLRDAMLAHGVEPAEIEVEVTENVCIHNTQSAIEQMTKLSQLGVSVAMDDFGTGYSSLSYLHRFPIKTIKIDQSFVREILDLDGHYPVVTAVIWIARGLGLKVIAEGVEQTVQAEYLKRAGCHVMQGYLFYRPMSHSAFLQHIALPAAG